MENLSLFIHSYVISNLNDFLSSVEYTHTNVFFRIFLTNFVHTMKVSGLQSNIGPHADFHYMDKK